MFGGCNTGPQTVALKSIAVTPANSVIARTTTAQFTATGTYTDNSTKDITAAVSWISSNNATASVGDSSGSYGLASGLTAGVCMIKAIAGGDTGTAVLTVTSATVVSISITPATAIIGVAGRQQYTAIGRFSDTSTQNISTLATWTSTNSGVASVGNATGSKGLANGIAAGSTSISAVFNGIMSTAGLTVSAATLSSIAVTPANPGLTIGSTEQFEAIGAYSDGSTRNLTTTATWSSSSTNVAAFSNLTGSNGFATALAAGASTITATSGGVSGSTTLTVSPGATLSSIAVTPAYPVITIGSTQQFAASGTYSDGSTRNLTTTATWSSSSTSVATIANVTGSNGLATAVVAGASTITATSGGVSGSTSLTVSARADSVTPASLTLGSAGGCSGGTVTGTFQVTAAGSVSWTATGDTPAVGGGKVVVTGGTTGPGTFTVTISALPQSPSSSYSNCSLTYNLATVDYVTVTFSDGSVVRVAINWTFIGVT